MSLIKLKGEQPEGRGFLSRWFPGRRPSPTPAPAPIRRAPAPRRGKKILIIDDDSVFTRAITMDLEHSGFDVTSAVDGSGAISMVRDNRPDLILLDLDFPPEVGAANWDGFEILNWLRCMDRGNSIPVIIVSAGDPERYADRSLARGACAFMHKSSSPGELLSLIEKALDGYLFKQKDEFDAAI